MSLLNLNSNKSSSSNSITFTLSGNTNILKASYYPPLELDSNEQYGLGLIGFYTYNSINNITDSINKIYFLEDNNNNEIKIKIPKGAYTVKKLSDYIDSKLPEPNNFKMIIDEPTQRLEIHLGKYKINVKKDCIANKLFQLAEGQTKNNIIIIKNKIIDILSPKILRISCNITGGSYLNEAYNHCIHEFGVKEPIGYPINEIPYNICHLPVIVSLIKEIHIFITDHHNNLVDFNGEKILVRLELKKL